MRSPIYIVACIFMLSIAGSNIAHGLDAATKQKLDAQVPIVKGWAQSSEIVNAVQAYNAQSTTRKKITQQHWAMASGVESFVRTLTENSAAQYLKRNISDAVSEAFVSGADGGKVAFLSKPTYWSHMGKPKHDVPMTGRVWIGEVEVDQSSGFRQIQIGVPVLLQGKPIGSLVVGFRPDLL
jgi:hypothetical protein